MKKILKYHLTITDNQTVVMPEGAQILTIQMQSDNISLWALCPETKKMQPRHIECFGTGHPIPNGIRTYIATIQSMGGSFIWHFFERA